MSFKIEFDIKVLQYDPAYVEQYQNGKWTILEIISDAPLPNTTFTKIEYNVPTNKLFFRQNTNDGLKTLSYNPRRHAKLHFKANANKVKYGNARSNGYKTTPNTLISKQTKFKINSINCDFFDVANLTITTENTDWKS